MRKTQAYNLFVDGENIATIMRVAMSFDSLYGRIKTVIRDKFEIEWLGFIKIIETYDKSSGNFNLSIEIIDENENVTIKTGQLTKTLIYH